MQQGVVVAHRAGAHVGLVGHPDVGATGCAGHRRNGHHSQHGQYCRALACALSRSNHDHSPIGVCIASAAVMTALGVQSREFSIRNRESRPPHHPPRHGSIDARDADAAPSAHRGNGHPCRPCRAPVGARRRVRVHRHGHRAPRPPAGAGRSPVGRLSVHRHRDRSAQLPQYPGIRGTTSFTINYAEATIAFACRRRCRSRRRGRPTAPRRARGEHQGDAQAAAVRRRQAHDQRWFQSCQRSPGDVDADADGDAPTGSTGFDPDPRAVPGWSADGDPGAPGQKLLRNRQDLPVRPLRDHRDLLVPALVHLGVRHLGELVHHRPRNPPLGA